MSNKELAVAFLQTLAANKVQDAYSQYVSPDFIHHNQYFAGDRATLLAAMEAAHTEHPRTKIEVKRIYEDGDSVITHSHVRHSPEDRGFACVHIFRFKSGKVVELWDLAQEIISDSPNRNGLF